MEAEIFELRYIIKKILVTTDFSTNSKAGIRFAIQLASQMDCELTFFYSYHIAKPASGGEKTFTSFEKNEVVRIEKDLKKFVKAVYRSKRAVPGKVHYAIRSSFIPDSNIIKFAADHDFDFICISRRGEGKVKKIFGTNTSNLILHSKVPVIAVPDTYRYSKISTVLYASDLSNLEKEMGKVVEFAKPLDAEIDLLHLTYPSEVDYNTSKIEKAISKFPETQIKYKLENINLRDNLVVNLQKHIKKQKPSVLVMFTDQNQGFFQRLFLSSTTTDYSFSAPVPLLILRKNK